MQIIKPFYLSWITVDELLNRLHTLELAEQERHEVTERILTTIHYEILDAILGLIPEDEHDVFLENMQRHSNPHTIFKPHEVTVEVVETIVKRRGERVLAEIHLALSE